ncbi:MAG TPA: hypothetical protein VN673_08030 [Clostridia bacterium]|nr:hypothetical protein [Clostridia bacterium]
MNAMPVIERELREESRRQVNYLLRMLAAGVLIIVFALVVLSWRSNPAQLGANLFFRLHYTLTWAFWIIVPLMTADCISREKREGTLGLLFLTPLTVRDVIAGKAAIHVIRALTLFLATIPVLGLPLVLGGVTWIHVLLAVLEQANAAVLAIGAGLLASVKGGTTVQVMARAVLTAMALKITSTIWIAPARAMSFSSPILTLILAGFGVICSAILCSQVYQHSRRELTKRWQDEKPVETPDWVRMFSNSRFWQNFFAWDKGRTLDRNPIGWLQEYSWTARLTKWAWFFGTMLIGILVLATTTRRSPPWQAVMTGILTLGLAFSAAGSFRRERESGLLELLLVTPLSAWQLILGRAWGMFCHYLPAFAMLLVAWWGERILNSYRSATLPPTMLIFSNPLALLAIVSCGMYLSLRRINFFLSWLATWVLGFLAPSLATLFLRQYGWSALSALGLPGLFQLVLTLGMLTLLFRRIQLRTFVVQTGRSE